MAEFLRVPADVPGGFITRIDRLDDGRVMCCICMEYKTTDELAPVEGEPGRKWDVCIPCEADEARYTTDRGPAMNAERRKKVDALAAELYEERHGEAPGDRPLGPGWDSWEDAREKVEGQMCQCGHPLRLHLAAGECPYTRSHFVASTGEQSTDG
jgi:hypothetical protein